MFTGRKLALTLAFTIFVALSFGASCQGFFQSPTLSTIAINPTAPAVSVGATQSLQLYGNYTDSSGNTTRSLVTSGVSWSSDTPSVATVTGTGGATMTGVSPGTANITASAQALTATAAATVILSGITQITVSPTSGNAVLNGSGFGFAFTAFAGATQLPLTVDNGGVLTITPNDGFITCTVEGTQEVCSAVTGAIGPYSIIMTYPGTTASATATLTVS
jgi:trimeric autotransporter adhesin